MPLLSFLFENLTDKSQKIPAIEVSHITNNSRDVTQNTLFLAYPGEKADGRQYISQAISQGAVAICYDPSDNFVLENKTIPCIAVKNLKITQSEIAARFYDFPSKKIPVIGVTGTNGKTSITHFIAETYSTGSRARQRAVCGIVGTMGYGFPPHLIKTANTTPDGLHLQKIFAELMDDGAQAIAMEVSSHALSQQRVNDIQFHTAVFTNLTQDHLDFHKTMENYRDAKELLFSMMCAGYSHQPEKKHSVAHAAAWAHDHLKNAVINIDDDAGRYFAAKYKNKLNVMTYSRSQKNADITVLKCLPTENGFDLTVKTPWGTGDFHLPLIGTFNIENALATLGVLGFFKIPLDSILKKLSHLKTVNGRMQLLHTKPYIIVDYAHTPDALEKVLHSVREHCSGKLLCVFGCGGDRDKTKRPIMGLIADHLADQIIITNDNPRSESPNQIAQDILNDVKNKNKFTIELDRAKAIKKAIQSADKNDWILIAGKGHETEQVMADQILHHSDTECVLAQVAQTIKECRNRSLRR